MLRSFFAFAASAVMAATLGLTTPALAQSGNISLELNAARDEANTCRLTFVATNNPGVALSEMSYEVVMFDSEGTVDQLLIMAFGEMARDKTKVVSFILGERSCSGIGRVLINNEAACTSAEGGSASCMSGLVTSSRIDIEFGI